MPNATEWLVTHIEEFETQYEGFATEDAAIDFLRQMVGQGKTAALYQLVPFEVQIGVTVKSPRRRRKKEAKEGAADPHAEGGRDAGSGVPSSAAPVDLDLRTAGPVPASPVFDCEARLDSAPPCPGPIEYDTFTHGRFCSLHMPAIQIDGRMELHRRNHARNRPVRVAHVG